MANTPKVGVRIGAELESAARARRPELAVLDTSTLVRVGLAVLAGMGVPDAIQAARRRRGPKPREGSAA